MFDLSSNDILDTLEHTNAHDAIRVDSTPEDWESIIDFETKTTWMGQVLRNPTRTKVHLTTG